MPLRKIKINTIDDLLSLRETIDVEFKKAAGKDGKGQIPNSLWETYSAFANTEGGYIFLGVEEIGKNQINVTGIKEYKRLEQDLHNQANNRDKVSVNLLKTDAIEEITINGKTILQVYIPRARRQESPVFIKNNPFKGSYIRRGEGDYVMDENSVKRIIAEQAEISADSMVLKGYTLDDLNIDTVNSYRNAFSAFHPNHPYITKSLLDFLKAIHAYDVDREENIEGITLAGLLMFGEQNVILGKIHNYILDYQEHSENKIESRWIDRITLDGTWSGNLYDFYRKVYLKLTSDLKVPFKLKAGIRIDETPIHEALREAFINTLIHADYLKGRVAISITKAPNKFIFRNPGLMRIPFDQALQGGGTDCRNRMLQKMFQFIGGGDQAGTGVPKIYHNWKQQHWNTPLIKEIRDPEQTTIELHMVSLIDDHVIDSLDKKFGENFRNLQELERLILATIVTEEKTNHKRILEISSEHPSDISRSFSKLVREGYLISEGEGRGTRYFLAQEGNNLNRLNSGGLDNNSGGLANNSGGLKNNSGGLDQCEKDIAAISKAKKKLSRDKMEHIIIQLCSIRPQSLTRLANLLDRNQDFLRKSYISPMVKTKKIKPLFKDHNHPGQAYELCKGE